MRRERAWLPWEEESIESPKVVEALLAEAEQGYDDPRAEFVSQPPDEEIEALRRIAFRVPAKVRQSAQKRADEEKRSLSDLAAEALRQYLGSGTRLSEKSQTGLR